MADASMERMQEMRDWQYIVSILVDNMSFQVSVLKDATLPQPCRLSLLLLVRPGRKFGMPFFFSHADGLVIQKGSNFRI